MRGLISGKGRRALVTSVAGLGALGLGVLGGAALSPASASSSSAAAIYVPMTPVRVLDTRSGLGLAAITPETAQSLQLGGVDGIPATGVSAVVANVTVTESSSSGYLTLYPAAGSVPTVSNLNFTQGETVANLATVPLNSSGQISLYSYLNQPSPSQVLLVLDGNPSGGSLQVVMDIEGYYLADSSFSQGLYLPLASATRIADTRPGSGQPDSGAPLAPDSATALTVTGADGVPAGASAVVLNLTAVNPTSSGYLTVYPAGQSQPLVSNLNFTQGEQISNRVIAEVGRDGQIEVYNYSGSTDLVVDVDGYYTGSTTSVPADAGAFTVVAPARIVDTRSAQAGSSLGGGGTESFQVSGAGGIPAESGSGPFAVAANVTVIPEVGPGYLTVYPAGQPAPGSSDVNWSQAGQIQPNFTQAALPQSGMVEVKDGSLGQAQVLVDVFGYFSAPPLA